MTFNGSVSHDMELSVPRARAKAIAAWLRPSGGPAVSHLRLSNGSPHAEQLPRARQVKTLKLAAVIFQSRLQAIVKVLCSE